MNTTTIHFDRNELDNIQLTYRCDHCDTTETVEPTFFEQSGTPVCFRCDGDMEIFQAAVKTETPTVLNEGDAMTIFVKIAHRHNWLGVTLTATDAKRLIESRRSADDLEPLSETELDNAVQQVLKSKEWTRTIPDWLNEQAFEALGDLLQGIGQ